MRGKHGSAAAVRHEVQSRDEQLATYQRRVAQLTAVNRELEQKLRDQDQAHRRTEREVRARIEHAASPKIEALELTLAARAEQVRRAETVTADLRKKWELAMKRMGAHFREEHGAQGVEVMETLMNLIFGQPGEPETTVVMDRQVLKGLSTERVRTMQKVRGERR